MVPVVVMAGLIERLPGGNSQSHATVRSASGRKRMMAGRRRDMEAVNDIIEECTKHFRCSNSRSEKAGGLLSIFRYRNGSIHQK